MSSALIFRAFWTAAYIFAAYCTAGVIATWLVGPSTTWWLVLAADFVLVIFCTTLSRVSGNDAEQESRTEALAVGIGTIAPIGVHALQFALQASAGGASQIGTASVLGAAFNEWWPSTAALIYIAVLFGWMLLSVTAAIGGALWARDPVGPRVSHWIAIALLAGATLFLLPWFGDAVRLGNPLPTLLRYLAAILLIGLFVAGASWSLRGLVVALRAAGLAARTLMNVAAGIGAALVPVAALVGIVVALVRFSGPIGDLARAAAVGLGWLITGLMALIVAGVSVLILMRMLSLAVSCIARALAKVPKALRGALMAALGAVGLLVGLFAVDRPHVGGSGGLRPPSAVHVEFEESAISCFGFRWQYGESNRIVAPSRNCLAYSDADFLIAVGSATPRGGQRSEPDRALRRGEELAAAVAGNLSANRSATRVYVLNRGVETTLSDDAREGPGLALFSGTAFPRGGEVNIDIVARDLARFLRTRPDAENFSHCDLYAYEQRREVGSPIHLRGCLVHD